VVKKIGQAEFDVALRSKLNADDWGIQNPSYWCSEAERSLLMDYHARHEVGDGRSVLVDLSGELPFKSWRRNGRYIYWRIAHDCGFKTGRGEVDEATLALHLRVRRIKVVILSGLESVPRRYGKNVAMYLLALFRNLLANSGVHLVMVCSQEVLLGLFEDDRFLDSVRRVVPSE